METKVRVLVADTSTLTHIALRSLSSKVPFDLLHQQSKNLAQALTDCTQYQPAVLLINLSLLGDTPQKHIIDLRRRFPGTKTVLVAENDEVVYLPALIRAGIAGYIAQNSGETAWLNCLQAVIHEGAYFPWELLAHWQQVETKQANRIANCELKERDIQLLHLLAQGCTNIQMAQALRLSTYTVNNNLSCLYRKLHVNSRAEAVAVAWRGGLMDQGSTT